MLSCLPCPLFVLIHHMFPLPLLHHHVDRLCHPTPTPQPPCFSPSHHLTAHVDHKLFSDVVLAPHFPDGVGCRWVLKTHEQAQASDNADDLMTGDTDADADALSELMSDPLRAPVEPGFGPCSQIAQTLPVFSRAWNIVVRGSEDHFVITNTRVSPGARGCSWLLTLLLLHIVLLSCMQPEYGGCTRRIQRWSRRPA
jgi:hypothetical protein